METNRWPALLDEKASRHDVALKVFGTLGPSIDRAAPDWTLAAPLQTAAPLLAAQLVAIGPGCCDDAWRDLESRWPIVLRALDAFLGSTNSHAIKSAIDFTNVAQCAGRAVPAEAIAFARPGLERVTQLLDQLSDADSFSCALSALAFGLPDLVPAFAGASPTVAKSFKPGRTFGFNLQGFTRYLAASMTHGGSAEDVEPAWRELVANFPSHYGADTLTWADLFSAARAVLVHFQKRDVGEVAAALHHLVRE